ncbi:MAG: response regulator [Kiritimatiellae bacterium]|nr:response regulator [Kiritimatiellia bacterium]
MTGSRRATVRIFLVLTVLVMVSILALANRMVWPAFENLECQTARQHLLDITRLLDQIREAVVGDAVNLAARTAGAWAAPQATWLERSTMDVVAQAAADGGLFELHYAPGASRWGAEDEQRARDVVRAAVASNRPHVARWLSREGGLWIVAAVPAAALSGEGQHHAVVAGRHLSGRQLDQLVPRSDRLLRLRAPPAPSRNVAERPPAEADARPANEDWLLGAVTMTGQDGEPEAVLEVEISRTSFHSIRAALRYGFFALLLAVAVAGLASALAADRAIRIDLDRHRTDERFRAITESVPDAILVVRENRIVAWNPAAQRIFGRERGEVLGRPLAFAIGSDGANVLRWTVPTETGHALSLPQEVELVRANGERFPAEITGGSWTTDDGHFHALVIRDITARKAMEQERVRLLERVQQTQRLESLGVLAGGIAHDFNNLLATILGHAEMAAVAETADDLAHCLEAVRTAGQRASDLVRQMLTYAGRAPASKRRLRLGTVFTDARGLLLSAVGNSVHLELQTDDQPPDIIADPAQIVQAAVNLLMNAAEAVAGRENGHIRLRTVSLMDGPHRFSDAILSGESASGRWAGFEVTDNGPGIPADVRLRIFDPFFTTKFPGRGLGLPVVAGIVRAHGGALMLSSDPGHGTTVTVMFPAAETPVTVPSGRPVARPSHRTRPGGRVLVVDDDPFVRDVASRMLRRLGADVETADGGPAALERFSLEPEAYSAVLLDWTMPEMDGRQTLHRLRAIRADVPVIVTSGFDDAVQADRLGELQVQGFLAKPFQLTALANLLTVCGVLQPVAAGEAHLRPDDGSARASAAS